MRKMTEPRKSFHAKALAILIVGALVAAIVGCEPAVMYSLTIESVAGGVVIAPGEDTFEYNAGTVVDLEALADVGHRFVAWTGDVGTIAKADAASTTVTINGDYSIAANFVAVYDLSVSSTDGGSVTTPGEGTFTYDDGTAVSLVATRAIGYQFAGWTGDVVTVADVSAASTTITINDDYSITADFEEEMAVVFVCSNLEAAIRDAIGIPDRTLYPSDLQGLAFLSAGGRNISDVTGLEYCVSLTELNLQDNQISDLSPLDGLTSLIWLSLASNQISDLSPLDGLTSLIWLSLGSNHISDISPLAKLTSLTWLSLWGNQIADTSSLANLTDMTGLNLGGNQIVNISPLAVLTSLTWLSLDNNQIVDITPLTDLTELADLNLWGNHIVNVSPLTNLTNLTELNLGDNRIASISPLANLDTLTNLHLSHNQIDSISPLANLTDLMYLSIGSNKIGNLRPLASLSNLTELDLGHNGLSDISALADVSGLTHLTLDTNQIRDISPLADLANLTYLRLWGNQILDASPLANLTDLTELDLGVNRISDISPLVNLSDLTHLYLNENRINDMSPLTDLTNLTWLSIWDNQIGDLAPLANLTNLTVLELGGNQISDISPLVENAGLSEGTYVDLRWNPLDSASVNTHVPQLEARGVKFNPEFPLVAGYPCVLDTPWIENPATGNYYALTVHMSWMAAEGCAQFLGGHLITLNSWEEELWIKNTFGWHESFWIGLNVVGREHRAGHFVWSSGEPVIYTNWILGEPNNVRGEDCAAMNEPDGWNDLSRHGHLRGVIEVSEKPG